MFVLKMMNFVDIFYILKLLSRSCSNISLITSTLQFLSDEAEAEYIT